MAKRAYFYTTELKSGEWVNLIFESASRKGTYPHSFDFWVQAHNKIELAGSYPDEEQMKIHSYILNEKNKDEQGFDDYRAIDLREE